MSKSRKELELEKKKLLLSITKAETAKQEIDMKVLEAEVQIDRLYKHQKLQDETIIKIKGELVELEERIKNYKEDNQ